MIRSEKKILALEIIMSLFFLINIFLRNKTSVLLVTILLLVAIALIYFIAGYEKDSNKNGEERHKIIQYISFYCLGFLILEYGIGLLTGYTKSPFKKDILSILANTFPIVAIIILSELLRYMIIKKGEKNKLILCVTIPLFVLIDLATNIRYWNLNTGIEILEFTTNVFLTSLFKNITLTTFTHKYGMKPSIIYRLITELYTFILPLKPDLGLYIESVILMVFPITLSGIISFGFDKNKKEKFRDKKKFSLTITIIIILTVTIVALNSNLFRYWMVSVGSGSMEPTINVGDAIIVDKKYQKHPEKIEVGDVLVFKIGENIYTHRVTKITNNNKEYNIKTKGDKKDQMEDSWIVKDQDIIGIVKFKIKYIGYPTVWLSKILEGNNG